MRGGWITGALVSLALLAPAGKAMADCRLGKIWDFPVTMRGLQPLIPAKINGVDGMFLADTGAFFGMLTPEGAAKFKLFVGPGPIGYVTGATGEARVGLARARDFNVVGQTIHGADFLVAPHNMGGEDGIIGDNLLSFADAEFDLANGVIRMWLPQDCRNADLAYWVASTQTYSEAPINYVPAPSNKILGWATIDGVKVRVLFDTGAGLSTLTLDAARRIGLTKVGSDLAAGGETAGISAREADMWLAVIKTFDLGDEHVANTHLRVSKIQLMEGAEMLIGADWFLSHRVYMAKSQDKMYFTYNGGPVFESDQVAPPTTQPTAATATAPTPGFPTNEPTDAAGFVRRGYAFLDRNDPPSAIADFSRAIALDPDDPKHYLDRGRALLRNRQPELATADFDKAIKLKPDDVDALIDRGALRLESKDDVGANTDFDVAVKAEPAARYSVAMAYSGAHRYDDVIAQLDLWLAAYPNDDREAAALNDRCWARAMLGRDLDKALADCNEAVKLASGEAQFLDSRGMAYLRLGRLDQSIADYNAVLKRQRIPWSFYGRGLAEEKKGLKAQGDADIAAATALDPKLPDEAKRFGLTP
jgi:tetratricopeptide (TPR) repeat protein/predicted aspartyl protease